MSKWEYVLFDIECNGFNANRIWVICALDLITREQKIATSTTEIAEVILLLQNAKMLVGHNIKSFDVRIIEKIMEGAIKFDRDKILDTLHLSKALVKMDDHKLEAWGEILGFEKLEFNHSFFRFHPDMIPYCKRDVDLNLQVFLALWALMENRHGETIPPKWQILTEYNEELGRQTIKEATQ